MDENCNTCQNATNLTTTNITSASATLNWIASVNPVQWQVQYKSTAPGAKWIDVPVSVTARSVTITGLKSKQAYNWHIRAKCGKTWTSYSAAVSFKTLAATQSVIVQGSAAENITNLRLYPNPTKGQFVIELHVPEKINGSAKIQLIDMTGKMVQTENAELRILVNDKIYKTQFVYGK